MKELIKSALKKVTLEMIYQVVEEKTEDIITLASDIKKKQEDDFRYLIQKIDTDIGNVRNEMNQFRNEVKNEIGQLRGEIGQLRGEMSQLNQRIDTIIQMLVNIRQSG
ncbi:MAG: hypothetical protein NUV74_15645 [Candidatus Brocadiaceae bacterium]|nr:hypothetical protein [Candidatus Brocadiaceae bacterium]